MRMKSDCICHAQQVFNKCTFKLSISDFSLGSALFAEKKKTGMVLFEGSC